jgi:hypothetical protein
MKLTADQIQKLDIKPNSILMVRVPVHTSDSELTMAMRTVRETVKNGTGLEPAILLIPRDCDLALLGMEALVMLRNEVEISINFLLQQDGITQIGN